MCKSEDVKEKEFDCPSGFMVIVSVGVGNVETCKDVLRPVKTDTGNKSVPAETLSIYITLPVKFGLFQGELIKVKGRGRR